MGIDLLFAAGKVTDLLHRIEPVETGAGFTLSNLCAGRVSRVNTTITVAIELLTRTVAVRFLFIAVPGCI